jgi:excisionase family DNA binding protein
MAGHASLTVAQPTESPASTGRELCELLTVEDVASILKVSKSWVYEHTRSRARGQAQQLPHIKVGKYVRFDPGALRAFIAKQCQTTT